MKAKDTEESVDKCARDVFGISWIRPFQRLVIMNIMERGKKPNLLTVLPTGSGKSLCFMLPSVLLEGITVIVYPLLSLMGDQARRFRKLGIPYSLLKGGMSMEEKNAVYAELSSRKSRILVTNVEMLSQKSVRQRLSHLSIELLVLDEAHTVISWGESFRPAYRELAAIACALEPRRILAFTATSDEETTVKLKKEILGDDALVIYGGLDRPNIIYHRLQTVFPLLDIIRILEKKESRPALVFCQSRPLTEELARKLSPYFRTYHYHAGLDKDMRLETERLFQDDHEAVMIATCAYGMGVDKGDIRSVIHYSLPQSAADYLQESGRAGRDGMRSHAYAFLGNSWRETRLETLFSEEICIRQNLAKAMGQGLDGACSGCDVCEHTKPEAEGLKEVRKALRIPYMRDKAQLVRKLAHSRLFAQLDRKDIERGIDRLLDLGSVRMRFKRLRWIDTGRQEKQKEKKE